MKRSDGDTLLLHEGAKSYSEALAVINEFCRLVRTTWRTALEADLGKISTAMSVKLDPKEIRDWAWPTDPLYRKEIDPEWAGVGLKIDRLKKDGWEQHYYLGCEPDENYIYASVRFKDRKVTADVFDALQRIQRKPGDVGCHPSGSVFLGRKLPRDEMDQVEAIIKEVNREWVRLWKRVGGLKHFLPR